MFPLIRESDTRKKLRHLLLGLLKKKKKFADYVLYKEFGVPIASSKRRTTTIP